MQVFLEKAGISNLPLLDDEFDRVEPAVTSESMQAGVPPAPELAWEDQLDGGNEITL